MEEMDLCMGPSAWATFHQGWYSYCHYWMSNLPAAENSEPPVWHYLSVRTARFLYPRKSNVPPYLCSALYSKYGFAFLTVLTCYQGLMEYLIYCHGILQNIIMNLHKHCIAKVEQQWFYDYSMHFSCWSNRRLKWPLKHIGEIAVWG